MNLNQLKVFHVAAEEKSFTRAAKKLCLTQPGISKHIKDLEKNYGVPLFDRVGKKIILTQAGDILFKVTAKIFSLIDEAKKKIDDLEHLHAGHLHIGASITLGIYVLLPFIKDFKSRNPQVDVLLDVSLSREVEEKVLNHCLDIGFIGAPTEDERLVVEEFIDDELILVFPPEHRWAGRKVVKIHDLESEPFILSKSGSGTRAILEDRFRNIGIKINGTEIGHTESVKRAVEAGLGVSILSKAVVERELGMGWLKTAPLGGINLKRRFYYIYHKDKYLSKTVKAFLSLAIAASGKGSSS
jgi:DNA-binding transcriptional LysR family regulator